MEIPSWMEIDPTAYAHNLAVVRRGIPAGTKIFAVCKGDGYGLGLRRVVALGLGAGVDGFCAGAPDEALQIREMAPAHFVLLFVSTLPAALPELCARNVTVTVNSLEALRTLCAGNASGQFFFEVDCGFGRFGLAEEAWQTAIEDYVSQDRVRCAGVYTHFGQSEPALLTRRLALFDRYVARLREHVTHSFDTMVASSDVVLARPDLPYTAIDPGRLLYGLIAKDRVPKAELRRMVTGIRSRVIQITTVSQSQVMKIGYGPVRSVPPGTRLAVFPVGWLAGLSSREPYGEVLVDGRRAPVLARTLQHTIIDISGIDSARLGSIITLMGIDGRDEISFDEMARAQNSSITELQFELGRALGKRDAEGAMAVL
jgi:alanine racemase